LHRRGPVGRLDDTAACSLALAESKFSSCLHATTVFPNSQAATVPSNTMGAESPKKPTKLPFKRTARRQPRTSNEDGTKTDPLEFFNRSAELQPLLTAEAKKRAHREAEKEAREAEREAARNRKSASAEKHDGYDEASDIELANSQKKRRTNEKKDEDDDMYDCTPPPPR
jgi:hypothetical protein